MTGPNQYFAVVDDQHDVKDPVTVVRVNRFGSVEELTEDASWFRSSLVERIEAGAIPYRLRSITEKAAGRIREQREKKVPYRYSILVRADDPTDTPVSVLREWTHSNGRQGTEVFSSYTKEWVHNPVRFDAEQGGDDSLRIIPADSSAVHLFVEAIRREQ